MGEEIRASQYSMSGGQFSASMHDKAREEPSHTRSASRQAAQDTNREVRFFGWNLGGAGLDTVKPALGDVGRGPLQPGDILLLQELPRSDTGWQTEKVEDRLVVHHRDKSQWRGTGIAIRDSVWSIQKRVAAGAGCWFKLKGLRSDVELWCGTFHFAPGTTLSVFESALHRFLSKKPNTTLPVVVQGDVNSHFRWQQGEEADKAVTTDGRSLLFHDRLVACGLHMVAPVRSQQGLPTSRPRQEARTGHHIDIIAVQRVLGARNEIQVDSFKLIGTDHEALFGTIRIRSGKTIVRHATRPRVWVGGVQQISHIDQTVLERMAKDHTKT